jgi:hypothetical protein
MYCSELIRILTAERIDLVDEIKKHKWHLSEKAGKDVGLKAALDDFMENHLDAWAEGYRESYCDFVCKTNSCGYEKEINEILSIQRDCEGLINLLSLKKPDLKSNIIKHQEYLSEIFNKDIGLDFSRKDYILYHLNDWEEGFSKCYCHLVCMEDNCAYKRDIKTKESKFFNDPEYKSVYQYL